MQPPLPGEKQEISNIADVNDTQPSDTRLQAVKGAVKTEAINPPPCGSVSLSPLPAPVEQGAAP